jgi:hypothetical protein
MGSRRFRGPALAKAAPQLMPDGRVLVASKIPTEQLQALMQGARAAVRGGDLRQAEARLRALVSAAPTAPHGRLELGLFLWNARRHNEAQAEFRRALRFSPPGSSAQAHAQSVLSGVRMAEGDYSAEALRWFEQRWFSPTFRALKPSMEIPEWDGRRPGKLAILPEQGMGDQIQMARFAPWLRRRGMEVVVVAPTETARLFQGLGVEVVMCAPRQRAGFPPGLADQWVCDFSLLQRLGVTLQTLPNDPYLPPPQPKLLAAGARFGVMTSTDSVSPNAWDRSMPDAAAYRLLSLPGAINLRPEATGARDLADTAAIIAGLDLVVTIDTAVAHLAGAMGKPVWILLPWFGRDWRWLRGRTDSPWYPSARLYEQPSHLDWHGLLDRVIPDLGKELGSGVVAGRRRSPFYTNAA